jgi:non-heme chloroperoxidase
VSGKLGVRIRQDGDLRLSAMLVSPIRIIAYVGFPHGMPTTEADIINADLLTFIEG